MLELDTLICKLLKKLLSERFGHYIFEDIYYDFESRNILFYDKIYNLDKKDSEDIIRIKKLYNRIIEWIQETFNYKLALYSSYADGNTLTTLIVFKVSKEQEDSLIGYAKIAEGNGD